MEIPTICLNMIVKDEEHIILKTLNNILKFIPLSYWVICDTGSRDNTKELIIEFFKNKNIPGELIEDNWVDFGLNRTKALEYAYKKTDFLLIFDADDSINLDFCLPLLFNHDKYLFKFGQEFIYYRPLLINNKKKWCFKGVLHEFLINLEPVTETKIEGNYYIQSGREGNRNKNPNKYLEDAIILKNAYYEEESKDKSLSYRYAFYCGQSYKDAGKNYINEAIEWYKKCLTLPMWKQEQYYSCLKIGELYMQQDNPISALHFWYKSVEFDPERMECIINALEYLRKTGEHLLVNSLYYKYKDYTIPLEPKLFLSNGAYSDMLEYNNIISAYYIHDLQSGYDCCKKIFNNRKLPNHLMKQSISNFKYYMEYVSKDKDDNVLQLFYSFDEIINQVSKNNEEVNSDMIKIWNFLFDKCRHLLTKPTIFNFTNRLENPFILITFTTCKRLNLFKETIYSILNHWIDLNQIDYWFCVDDNSSSLDRNEMSSLFPWINYYFKSNDEKGHRQSMNIIWNKLYELKPKYWIHMEDDWLFFNKQNYIENAINGLNYLKKYYNGNIKQILFNRNYGQTIQCYNSLSHENSDNPNVIIHKYDSINSLNTNTHSSWPNYSFRPSLIDVKTILNLGNYDSENSFFEKDYALKWTKAEFKSAFFNRNTSRHIGRLTWENHKPNAYDLNNVNQFENVNQIENVNQFENVNQIENNSFIKIINLKRRLDRKQTIIEKLRKLNLEQNKYEFINAIDGIKLNNTPEIFNLFKDNDFNYRKGVIGCALSHYNLWKKLINDQYNDYYLILEDDCSFNPLFIEKVNLFKKNGDFLKKDVIFLGYHMFEEKRQQFYNIYNKNSTDFQISPLNKNLYIGGTFTYSINKNGATKLIDNIEKNGIKHGIDYLIKINEDLDCYECQPQLVFSEWNEHGKKIDSNIQNLNDSLFSFKSGQEDFIFIPKLDQIGFDLYFNNNPNEINKGLLNKNCVAYNTLGFFKSKIVKLTESNYFKENDGIYIKKDYYYNVYLKNINIENYKEKCNKIRIKMLCNWCSSEQLCKEWSNMCKNKYDFSWNNLEITWTNDNIDYYVIINKPLNENEFYIPEKTILLQMEPWVYDKSKNWGVKTWVKWSNPDETKFLKVLGRKTQEYNNVFWQLEKNYNELINLSYDFKLDKVSSICSNKYFDEGHKHRIDFLKFLEDKNDIDINIFSQNNLHDFKNYQNKSIIPYINKSDGYIPYKYYFMVENNYENNFITEKLWEPILCECLCFYYGCPNVLDYINENAFVLLDIYDFEKSYQIIKKAIEEDWWSKRINEIRKQKEKLLNEMQFFPRMEKLIQKLKNSNNDLF